LELLIYTGQSLQQTSTIQSSGNNLNTLPDIIYHILHFRLWRH